MLLERTTESTHPTGTPFDEACKKLSKAYEASKGNGVFPEQ